MFKCIDLKSLSSFVNLERITLNRASLFDTSFQGLFRLESLELIECDFENFKSASFCYLPNLKKLIIGEPKNFYNGSLSSKLQPFSLEGSRRSFFESLKHDNLEKLDLKFAADFDYFDGKSLSGLPKLKSLKLASTSTELCKIKSFNLNYDSLSRLELLSLARFHFSSFDTFILPELSNLKVFALLCCKTESKINHADLFKRLRHLETLVIVDFDDFFTDIPSTVFDGLENLTRLEIPMNKLTNINPEWFSFLKNLSILSLSACQLNQLSDVGAFIHLKNLEYLKIFKKNDQLALEPDVFNELKKLKKVRFFSLNLPFELIFF